MEFGQLMADIPAYVSCKFEKYIFEITQVIGENVPIAFLYVLSIHTRYVLLYQRFCTVCVFLVCIKPIIIGEKNNIFHFYFMYQIVTYF